MSCFPLFLGIVENAENEEEGEEKGEENNSGCSITTDVDGELRELLSIVLCCAMFLFFFFGTPVFYVL